MSIPEAETDDCELLAALQERISRSEDRQRYLASRVREEHEWTMHMLLDLRNRIDAIWAAVYEKQGIVHQEETA